ncbi:potassium channel family protein [Guptibacillus hwajinpoensis]|uniref:potassium channel family protein n=1 Tax=Guptibacillus hwajinpoensis TaxID=208199 RepID=UPI001CFF08B7|nr:potassium channel family protein [Pseudalkalibacillus hwajinpoensis]WLR60886.1 ion channel [Pseudalkalibacillus hwajinpoensis]
MLFRIFIKNAIKLNNRFMIIVAIALVIVSAFVMRLLEPETFPSLFDSFWWVMTTVTTVGYGDYFPVTVGGRIYAMFLYIAGIGLIGVVIGKFVDGFAEIKKRKEEGKMPYQGDNHIVIIGWSQKAAYAVSEIRDSDKCEIVIIDKLPKTPLTEDNIHYIQGDAAEEATLKKADIMKAKAVLVFSDDAIHDSLLADGKSLIIASSIERMSTDIHTTVEVMKEEHIKNFTHVQVDEFVLSHEAVSRMAVRSAFTKGIAGVYSQLLSRGHGDNLYEIAVHPDWNTYREAFQDLLQQGATLVADGNRMDINRRLDEPISRDAKLFVICDKSVYEKISKRV